MEKEPKLTPPGEAEQAEKEAHKKADNLCEESRNNPENDVLKRQAGYAVVEWTEALERLKNIRKKK